MKNQNVRRNPDEIPDLFTHFLHRLSLALKALDKIPFNTSLQAAKLRQVRTAISHMMVSYNTRKEKEKKEK